MVTQRFCNCYHSGVICKKSIENYFYRNVEEYILGISNDLALVKFRVSQILLLVGPLITLAVNTWTNYDPISLPKVFVLATSAFAIISLALGNFGNFKNSLPKSVQILALGFLGLESSRCSIQGLRVQGLKG